MPRTIAIIQARLGSTRLPYKALFHINERPMLWHVVNRTRKAATLDDVVVATSFSEADRDLVQWCQINDIPVHRGGSSENDVLGRFVDVATITQAEVIVRICGDSPMIDPAEIDRVVSGLLDADYSTNAYPGSESLPDGLDVEAITARVLTEAHREATDPFDREHVTPWIQRNKVEKTIVLNEGGETFRNLRFCVDDQQDVTFARAVFADLGDDFAWMDVVRLLDAKPEIAALMGGAKRNAGAKRKP